MNRIYTEKTLGFDTEAALLTAELIEMLAHKFPELTSVSLRILKRYDIKGMDKGLLSAIELVMLLKQLIPDVFDICVCLHSDHSYPREDDCYYSSYDEFYNNQNEYKFDDIRAISVGRADEQHYIRAVVHLDTKNIGFYTSTDYAKKAVEDFVESFSYDLS